VAPLLSWYGRVARDLPWRRTRDPYAIWVSEVMLQQTQVATVIPYYERWLERFPTVAALASSDEDAVLHAWQGLGYYSRARALLAGARAVVERHDGRIPRQLADLRALPGVGPYTAGAIASIAHGQRVALVDGNVKRVLTRLFALRGDPARAPLEKQLWALAEQLVPEGHASEFNQALMELGATVCTPKSPRCHECPVAKRCGALKLNLTETLPELAKRPPATRVRMAAGVVERSGKLLLVRVADDAARWAGMWQFPNAELSAGESPEAAARRAVRSQAGLDVLPRELVTVVKHGVTRYRITLEAFRCTARGSATPKAGTRIAWKRPHELAELALPAAHARIAKALA
jgi:A/G-specific adenine glycosylase